MIKNYIKCFFSLPIFELHNPNKSTYKIVNDNEQQGILCLECKLTSYSKEDIKYLYCVKCNVFHNQNHF